MCKEHNLSVIIPSGNRSKKYNEWQAEKNGTSWKTQIRKDINQAIQFASNYDEFLLLLKAKGYEIKGKTFEENASKYISFRPLNKERFVRGSVKSLGKEYTKERIREHIASCLEYKSTIHLKNQTSKQLIDINDEKFTNSPGLKRWVTIENLKTASALYNEAHSITELEQKLSVALDASSSAKKNLLKLEKRRKALAELIKYGEQYKSNLSFYSAYKKAKHPDTYFRKHESQLLLFVGAKRMLEQMNVDLKSLNVNKWKAEYQELETKKKELSKTYKTCEKESKELRKQLTLIVTYYFLRFWYYIIPCYPNIP